MPSETLQVFAAAAASRARHTEAYRVLQIQNNPRKCAGKTKNCIATE